MKIAFFGDSLTEGFPGVPYFSILEKRFPEHELLNYGKGGDTVLSLYKRISKLRLPDSLDLAFLWVGTNDVLVNISPAYPVIKTMIQQQWSRSEEEFEEYYRSLLLLLLKKAKRVITVAPVFIGEDINNPWNSRLGILTEIIQKLSGEFGHVDFLDLRETFYPKLSGLAISDHLPKSVTQVGLDVLRLRDPRQIDEKSAERGLHFTLDGVHFNSRGAALTADRFAEGINT